MSVTHHASNGKTETYVPGFDRITGGGLVGASIVLVRGDFGRKELLVRQICWNILREGAEVLYYTVDHPADDVRQDMTSYGWDIRGLEKAGRFKLVDVFSDSVELMLSSQTLVRKESEDPQSQEVFYNFGLLYKEILGFLLRSPPVGSIQRILVIDSLSPLLLEEPEGVFSFLRSLKSTMAIAKATGISIMHNGLHEKSVEETVESLADGIIEFTRISDSVSLPNLIEVVRYSGEFEQGLFPIEVDSNGLRVVPIALEDLVRGKRKSLDGSREMLKGRFVI